MEEEPVEGASGEAPQERSPAGGSETPEADKSSASLPGESMLSEEERTERMRAAQQKALEIQEKHRAERLMNKIKKMNVAEKVMLALRGGSEARSILLKDPNRQVVMSVLENPQITESEIVAVARNRSSLEEALRVIAGNREWMKSYTVVMALVTNPKTPSGIAMKLVSGLGKRDLRLLEKDRGVSEAVRITAKRTLLTKEKK